MARTIQMRLIELMVLRQDISNVIEYLGKNGNFQFQSKKHDESTKRTEGSVNIDEEFFNNLQKARVFLNIKDLENTELDSPVASDEDRNSCTKILASCNLLNQKFSKINEDVKRVNDAYKEALSFANLQVPYAQLEHLSFITMRIGKIPQENLKDLQDSVGMHGVIVPLGNDKSKIMAISSKKGRFALDTELNKYGFVKMEVPENFKGIPEEAIESLRQELMEAKSELARVEEEKANYIETHKDEIYRLLKVFSVGMQIRNIENNLESTSLVSRITGWIPANFSSQIMKDLDELTQSRIAIREYLPSEVPSVLNGEEQIPVKLKHGKFVTAFERMVFSYGSPLYGNIDPTPFVAVFFTLLFGIMFGDMGQGLVFLIAGILMALKVIKVGGWNKFAPIFMAIGITSSIMGFLTGEFFANETILERPQEFVTGLFGTPHAPILKMMPSSDPNSIKVIFGIFGFTIAVGFVINSIGLIINMINRVSQKKYGSALFGKTGLAGSVFFWYVVVFAVRLAFLKHQIHGYDWIVIGVSLFFAAFGEPFERLLDGERPVMENGFGSLVIGGVVELIEIISSYLSSSISFVRVGAFALAHAVLGFIIEMMAEKSGAVGGVFVMVAGNAIVVVLEGMIVAIQVIRLQYYEFFSKFFSETGSEFKPLSFHYGNK